MQKTNFKTRLLALLTAVFHGHREHAVCSVCRRRAKQSPLLFPGLISKS